MYYLNLLAGLAVSETPDGRRLFYPWGRFSRCYEIETAAHERTVRWVVCYQLLQLLVVFPTMVFAGWYALVIVPAILAGGLLLVGRLVRGMTPAGNPAAGDEPGARWSAFSPFTLWLLLFAMLFFAVLGFSELLGGNASLVGGLATAVSLFGAYKVVEALRFQAREKRPRRK